VLTFWWDNRSEIRPSQSSREWKFKSDNAALISCVLFIQDMIRESGIPSGVEIGGWPLLFAPPIFIPERAISIMRNGGDNLRKSHCGTSFATPGRGPRTWYRFSSMRHQLSIHLRIGMSYLIGSINFHSRQHCNS
jgi:hypothetical protein